MPQKPRSTFITLIYISQELLSGHYSHPYDDISNIPMKYLILFFSIENIFLASILTNVISEQFYIYRIIAKVVQRFSM